MSILKRLKEIKELPTLPEVMFKVQKLVNFDKSDAAMLADIIKQDPSLTSTILKIANSAFYNITNRRISSLTEAIARIGYDEVFKITMAVSAIEQFSNTKTIIGYKSFWQHSLTAASMTLEIVKMMKKDCLSNEYQDLFLAGLLHDIGILIYDQFFHDEFTNIIEYALREEKSYLYSENIIAAKETHAFIGGALLEIWKLTLPIINAVRYHHTIEKCPQKLKGMVAIVSLTEYILCSSYLVSFEGRFLEMDESVWEITGISKDDLDTLYQKAEAETRKADLIIGSGSSRMYGKHNAYQGFDHLQLRSI